MPPFTTILGSVSLLFGALPLAATTPLFSLSLRDTPPSIDELMKDAPDFSQDQFPPYPPLPDSSNITTENWRGTRLFGWKGCGVNEVNSITEAWNDFYTLAQQKSLYQNIDWSGRPAQEIWGHSTADKYKMSDKTRIKSSRSSNKHSRCTVTYHVLFSLAGRTALQPGCGLTYNAVRTAMTLTFVETRGGNRPIVLQVIHQKMTKSLTSKPTANRSSGTAKRHFVPDSSIWTLSVTP